MDRNTLLNARRAAARAVLATLLATVGAGLPGLAAAATAAEINAYTREALEAFRTQTSAGAELASRAAGVLVFPRVYKAGIGLGGEFGEGELRVGGATVGYYNMASASIGLQLGAQQKSVVILFMTQESLARFRRSKGWKAGVDGSVALATLGAGGELDTETAQKPIIGFVFSNKGLMYNLTFEGTKITRIRK